MIWVVLWLGVGVAWVTIVSLTPNWRHAEDTDPLDPVSAMISTGLSIVGWPILIAIDMRAAWRRSRGPR